MHIVIVCFLRPVFPRWSGCGIEWARIFADIAGSFAGIIDNMSSYMLAQRIKPPAEASGPKQEEYVALLVVCY